MSNSFEVQTFYTEDRSNVNILAGWSTVYETDDLDDARRQLQYIMSTPFARNQYSNPDACRVIRNGREHVYHLSEKHL